MDAVKYVNNKGDSKSCPKQTMERLYLDKEETGDVTFIIESQKIRAHKCVLAATSPKYKAQFYGLQPENGDIIVEGVTADAFKEFLKFFYLEKADFTPDNIEEVLSLAKQSLVEQFVEDCIEFLSTEVKDACLVYRLALLYDLKELIEVCLQYISENTMQMFKSDGFLVKCNRDMLVEILKLDSLNCKETETFEACILWAKANCISKNVNAKKMENLRAELGDAIYEIRFRSLTIGEFVHLHSLHEGFFTAAEMQEIIYMIGNLKNFQPSKFNPTRRNEEMQLNRIVHKETRENWFFSIVPVSFFCNKRIRLKGFAAGFQIPSNGYKLQITITDENKCGTEHDLKYDTITQQRESIVTFEKPIVIKPNSHVHIALVMPSIEAPTKYTLAKVVEVDNYKFEFKVHHENHNASGILLTQLFFNKI